MTILVLVKGIHKLQQTFSFSRKGDVFDKGCFRNYKKDLRCKLSQKQMFKPFHLLNAASLKFHQINASFGTMKPFLFDSNFRNGYSLYHKVADLFDTFEGKFIPALRLLLVYLGDKCQRVPLLITRLRFWHCGWGSVTSYVQIPPFSHNCRKSRSVVTAEMVVTIMGYHLPNYKRV